LGLLWHSHIIPMSAPLRKYGGDGLWALLVFLSFAFLFHRLSTAWVALTAFCFTGLVEFSQLYHASWIDAIRQTTLGRLSLGSTFNWADFIAYAVGIIFGTLLELLLRQHVRRT